jgi:hypothetical protein
VTSTRRGATISSSFGLSRSLTRPPATALRLGRTPPHRAPGGGGDDPQAHIFREHKFHLRLCEYSFDVLLRFLHGQDFMLLLSVLNDRVTFKVPPPPRDAFAPSAGGREAMQQ